MPRVQRTFIASLPSAVGQAAVIRGWIYRLRVLAKTTFIIVKDCTGDAQCVVGTESLRGTPAKVDDAVEIHGIVRADARARAGIEVDVTSLTVLNPAATPLPFASSSAVADVSLEIRTEWKALAVRN